MPTLSQFYGIAIQMYFWESEHNPPHVHAVYGGRVEVFAIPTGESLDGRIPKRARRMVQVWIEEHREELLEIWLSQEFRKIKPLSQE